jgi:hypothetical protein
VAGVYGGSLDSNGETLTLSQQSGTTIKSFIYANTAPWPTDADGGGFSLVLINPQTNPNHSLAANWRPSRFLGGNPGTADRISFADWSIGHGTTTATALLDGDNDGLSNLAEYALGSNPGTIDSVLPETGMDVDGHMTLTFTRPLHHEDVDYIVQTSTELVSWLPNAEFVTESVDASTSTVTQTYRSPDPISGPQRVFMNLKVQLRP